MKRFQCQRIRRLVLVSALATVNVTAWTAETLPQMTNDLAGSYDAAADYADYVWREEMIPMRDGIELYTVIVMKKGVTNAPILMSRTPYDAGGWARRNFSRSIVETVPVADREFVEDGYIRVFQDIRGRFKSEGEYVVTRPLRGPLNRTETDHSTDCYDTIDWLVKNLPESNGRVAINGSSYPGFLALMATIEPHPALKAVVSMSPMVDGWIGDDWFHNGAFRQSALDFVPLLTTDKQFGDPVPTGKRDQYKVFLNTGSAGDYIQRWGLDAFPFIKKLIRHETYDRWWQLQAVDKILAERPLTVPTMIVMPQWDAEDSYGGPAVYRVLEAKDTDNDMVYYALGPWRHSGVLHYGSELGPLRFTGDTAKQFRDDVQKPFLDGFLKDGRVEEIPPVVTYATGQNEWKARESWPGGELEPLFFTMNGRLSFEEPEVASKANYVSDPANPVPFRPRPIYMSSFDDWHTWLLHDQRFADSRPDVLTYATAPLEEPLEIAGQALVDLFAATSGTDSDWIVKLIDAHPEEMSHNQKMAGYQLPVAMEIFRGRYVDSFEDPRPLESGSVENYRFRLPDVNHVFQRGHRIMIQVQSSWFPLYDRNPQQYVDNIFFADSKDYVQAQQTVFHGKAQASAIWLPIVSSPSGEEIRD